MTKWFDTIKSMIQQLLAPQSQLQPIKIEVERQPVRQPVQRRRRR